MEVSELLTHLVDAVQAILPTGEEEAWRLAAIFERQPEESAQVGQLPGDVPTPILDGSTSACGWGSDPDAIEPGIFGPGNYPQLTRADYVANSNNSPRC